MTVEFGVGQQVDELLDVVGQQSVIGRSRAAIRHRSLPRTTPGKDLAARARPHVAYPIRAVAPRPTAPVSSLPCPTPPEPKSPRLGATSRDIVVLIVGNGLLRSLAGVVLGVVASAFVTPLLSGFLFGGWEANKSGPPSVSRWITDAIHSATPRHEWCRVQPIPPTDQGCHIFPGHPLHQRLLLNS